MLIVSDISLLLLLVYCKALEKKTGRENRSQDPEQLSKRKGQEKGLLCGLQNQFTVIDPMEMTYSQDGCEKVFGFFSFASVNVTDTWTLQRF